MIGPEKIFFIEPAHERRASYSEFANDLELPRDCSWRDHLLGGCAGIDEAGAEKILCERPAREAERLSDSSGSRSLTESPFYRTFCKLAGAIVSGNEVVLGDEGCEQTSPDRFGAGEFAAEQAVTLEDGVRRSRARVGVKTSGTTGRPKLIWHAMDTLCRGLRVAEHHRDDVWGFAYDPAHFAGIQVFLQALANRNTIVRLFGLEPVVARAAILGHEVTHLSSTPTFIKMLCGEDARFPSVKRLTLGGEAIDTATESVVRHAFPNARLRNVYASTELGSILSSTGNIFTVPDVFSGKVIVLDGELHVSPELLADSIHTDEKHFATGDLVEVLSERPLRFRFVGRRGDWINVGGEKVNPHTVEAALTSLPGVSAARVFGTPNSVLGNLVSCEIVLADRVRLSESELKDALQNKLSRYEVPQIFRFVDQLTLTSSGKLQR